MNSKFDEIGSEYWKADRGDGIVRHCNTIEEAIYTASGRSAQTLILQSARINNKRALLPAYTCQHIVEPFSWNGWTVDFYEVKKDLTPNFDDFQIKIENTPGCIIIESYYSFPTAKNIIPLIKRAQDNGSIIIEDVTHSFLNQIQRTYADADFEFCSLRKWSGLSDGGYAIPLRGDLLKKPYNPMTEFSNERHEARELKKRYIETMDPKLKEEYLRLYSHSESMLDNDVNVYAMSEQAYDDFIHLDLEAIKIRRRINYEFLYEHIVNPLVRPIFGELPDGIVPIMFPVYIDNNRDRVRNHLIDKRIYCPVHWPVPVQLSDTDWASSRVIYENIMSIPCDQRYAEGDLERLVEIINRIN